MKANEIRFGNWVLNGFGEPIQVNYIISEGNTSGYKLSTLHPIPLTPEILEKAGFEVLQSDSVLNITHAYNGYINLNTYTNSHKYWWLRYYQGGTNAKIYYLHQLQNLFYSLCGVELEIKL